MTQKNDIDLVVEQMFNTLNNIHESNKKQTSSEHARAIKKRADDWLYQKELEQIDIELNLPATFIRASVAYWCIFRSIPISHFGIIRSPISPLCQHSCRLDF